MLTSFGLLSSVVGIVVVAFFPAFGVFGSAGTVGPEFTETPTSAVEYPSNEVLEENRYLPLTEEEKANNVFDDGKWYADFGKCLTDAGLVFYGMDTCSHCDNQKELLADGFEFVNYIECSENQAACDAADIKAVPTWTYPGGKVTGYQSIMDLSEISGC